MYRAQRESFADDWDVNQSQSRSERGINDATFTDAPQGEFDRRQAGLDKSGAYGGASGGYGQTGTGSYAGNTTDFNTPGTGGAAGGGFASGRQQRDWDNQGQNTASSGGFNDEDYGTSQGGDTGTGYNTRSGQGRSGGKPSFGDKVKGKCPAT